MKLPIEDAGGLPAMTADRLEFIGTIAQQTIEAWRKALQGDPNGLATVAETAFVHTVMVCGSMNPAAFDASKQVLQRSAARLLNLASSADLENMVERWEAICTQAAVDVGAVKSDQKPAGDEDV